MIQKNDHVSRHPGRTGGIRHRKNEIAGSIAVDVLDHKVRDGVGGTRRRASQEQLARTVHGRDDRRARTSRGLGRGQGDEHALPESLGRGEGERGSIETVRRGQDREDVAGGERRGIVGIDDELDRTTKRRPPEDRHVLARLRQIEPEPAHDARESHTAGLVVVAIDRQWSGRLRDPEIPEGRQDAEWRGRDDSTPPIRRGQAAVAVRRDDDRRRSQLDLRPIRLGRHLELASSDDHLFACHIETFESKRTSLAGEGTDEDGAGLLAHRTIAADRDDVDGTGSGPLDRPGAGVGVELTDQDRTGQRGGHGSVIVAVQPCPRGKPRTDAVVPVGIGVEDAAVTDPDREVAEHARVDELERTHVDDRSRER